jgi:hypothetical protein
MRLPRWCLVSAIVVAWVSASPAAQATQDPGNHGQTPAEIILAAGQRIRDGDRTVGASTIVRAVEVAGTTDLVWLAVRVLWNSLTQQATDGVLEASLTRIFADARWRDDPGLEEERRLAASLPAERAHALVTDERYAEAAVVLEELADTFPDEGPEALRRAALARGLAGDLDGASRDAATLMTRWPGISVVTDPVVLIAPRTRFVCGHALRFGYYDIWWN